jgi:serine/threonine-protein kinase HipA
MTGPKRRHWRIREAAQELSRFLDQLRERWRTVASAAGAKGSEIARMASAFEHDDLTRALAI